MVRRLVHQITIFAAAICCHADEVYQKEIASFLKAHCVECHGPKKRSGNLQFDSLAPDFADGSIAARWVEVMDAINLGEMPPPKKPRPEYRHQRLVTDWISTQLRTTAISARGLNKPAVLRRLTRTEYANTVRDLLCLSFPGGLHPARFLPPDGKVEGFDKHHAALLLDASLLQSYLDMGQAIGKEAVLLGSPSRPPIPTEKRRFEYEDIPIHPYEITTRRWTLLRPNGLELMAEVATSKGRLRHSHAGKMIPVNGRYTVRVRAGAAQGTGTNPVMMQVWRPVTGETVMQVEVRAPIEQPEIFEVTREFEAEGGNDLNVFILNGTRFTIADTITHQLSNEVEELRAKGAHRDAGRLRAQMRAEGAVAMNRPNPATLETSTVPRLFLDWIEIEGPLYGAWPPRSHTILMKPAGQARDAAALVKITEAFATQAFRGAATPEDIAEIVKVGIAELNRGTAFEESVRAIVTATLSSPRFLLLGGGSTETRLASRLSYFLWSSMPDETLLRSAKSGDLRDPKRLAAAVERMLSDSRSEALVEDFAAQWLKVNDFSRFAPDRVLYDELYRPENAGLDADLKNEPLRVFEEALRRNVSVLCFLDSDWTMVNERLARFYGLPPVPGEGFRRVSLPSESHRGGLIAMAGVHRLGSDGSRTKPVHRGAYLRDVLFNAPPEPPPPNAGEVEPNVEGKNLTVRQRLDGHRQIESCAQCHAKIDPYGLALENYNAVGKWRDRQDGEVRNWAARGGAPAIDASGVLPNGKTFRTPEEFKRALLEQSDRFLRGLSEKMLVYALNRSLGSSDRPMVNEILSEMKSSGTTLRALVHAIARRLALEP